MAAVSWGCEGARADNGTPRQTLHAGIGLQTMPKCHRLFSQPAQVSLKVMPCLLLSSRALPTSRRCGVVRRRWEGRCFDLHGGSTVRLATPPPCHRHQQCILKLFLVGVGREEASMCRWRYPLRWRRTWRRRSSSRAVAGSQVRSPNLARVEALMA